MFSNQSLAVTVFANFYGIEVQLLISIGKFAIFTFVQLELELGSMCHV